MKYLVQIIFAMKLFGVINLVVLEMDVMQKSMILCCIIKKQGK